VRLHHRAPLDRRGTAEALVAIRAECGDSKRLSLMPLFGGLHGYDVGQHQNWYVVLESLREGCDQALQVSPWRVDEMRRFGMLYPVGEGGDAVTIYGVDMRAVAHALGAA
jgi:hypothetical protein